MEHRRQRFRNGPLAFGKGVLYEGGIRVPYIVQWPGVAAEGKVSDDIVSSLDLLPTFLAAAGAGLPTDREYDGVDLRPSLEGKPNGLAQRRSSGESQTIGLSAAGVGSGLERRRRAATLRFDFGHRRDKGPCGTRPEIVAGTPKTAWTEWNQKNAPPPKHPESLRTLGSKKETAEKSGITK